MILITVLLLSGCGLYNLGGFTLPDDTEFLALIQELDTPEKICQYMTDNFEFEEHPLRTLTPYELFLNKKGDCNDFSTFAIFIADYHSYETYQIRIYFQNTFNLHRIAVYKEYDKYNYSSNMDYFPIQANNFKEIVEDYNDYDYRYKLKYYVVYDYDMNIIETNEQ